MKVDVDADVAIMKTLSIEILAFGLGLNSDGSESLVSTSLDEFDEVMTFALNSMTKSGVDVGAFSEIEVVPWTDNAAFLQYARLSNNRVLVPKPRSVVENAKKVGYDYTCTYSNLVPDDFGKCCDTDDSRAGETKSMIGGVASGI